MDNEQIAATVTPLSLILVKFLALGDMYSHFDGSGTSWSNLVNFRLIWFKLGMKVIHNPLNGK